MESDWPAQWKLAVTWTGGTSASVPVSPNEAWRAEGQLGSYLLVSDDGIIPPPGEIAVTSSADRLLGLEVLLDNQVVVVMQLPRGMRAAIALATSGDDC